MWDHKGFLYEYLGESAYGQDSILNLDSESLGLQGITCGTLWDYLCNGQSSDSKYREAAATWNSL